MNQEPIDDEITTGCLECIQLKETFRKTTLALGLLHDEQRFNPGLRGQAATPSPLPARDSAGDGSPRVKDVAYIHKEAELYEANNKARRAWNEHREKVHEGAFA